MWRDDRSSILAGFVFAALFVIVLVCFSRTTYMFRGTQPVLFDRPDMILARR
jgi:hypothetical protein